MAEDGVILPFDRVQNFLAAAAEEIEIDGEFAINFFDQRQALAKPIAGALDFELHHGAEGRSVLVIRDLAAG